MRRAMICVSFMLALVQLWPLIFGHRNVADVAAPPAQVAVMVAVPKRVAAVATLPAPQFIDASVSKIKPPVSCFQRYRSTFAACAKGDLACGAKAADRWDLCEATGFWPE